MQLYYVIGLMSGTSLDGLDIAYVEFLCEKDQWSFHLLHSKAIQYSNEWKNKLNNAMSLGGLEIHLLKKIQLIKLTLFLRMGTLFFISPKKK